MGVTHIHAGNSTNQVDVLPALGIINEFFKALNRIEGLFIVMGVEWKDVAPQSSYLIVCLTMIRFGAGRAEAPRHNLEFMTL